MRIFITILFLVSFNIQLTAQSTNKHPKIQTKEFKVNNKNKLHKQLKKLSVFENSLSGLCVYDVKEGKYISEYNAELYFTPASNTKIFSYFSGTRNISKNIPVLFYTENNDSLIFWGSGAPTLLYQNFIDTSAYSFLKKTEKEIFFSNSNFQNNSFGTGWSWDDYEEYYSKEINSLPIYGNAVNLTVLPNGKWSVNPKIFTDSINVIKYSNKTRLHRNRRQNIFTLELSKNIKDTLHFEVPFITSNELTVKLLSDTLNKNIKISDKVMSDFSEIKTIYGINSDSIYKIMMLESDNFLAEQVLLMSAEKLEEKDSIKSSTIINKLLNNKLSFLTNKPRWVDGSGLSRYNLFTPKSMVEILNQLRIDAEIKNGNINKLLNTFPIGGKTGTLKNRFKNQPPFIYAKTGTLSNNHNVSGYLITKSGKVLIFSYMNNHYMHKTSTIKKQTDKILTDFYLYYK
ncbi:MAG: D-alanyl-D-alanine carboxypeptidase [Ichthyobacteriaceae bacterium]|nr:D-alanyl-D-alanine carboxypeptidase [Ichthyobacteriaceae bacterium]